MLLTTCVRQGLYEPSAKLQCHHQKILFHISCVLAESIGAYMAVLHVKSLDKTSQCSVPASVSNLKIYYHTEINIPFPIYIASDDLKTQYTSTSYLNPSSCPTYLLTA